MEDSHSNSSGGSRPSPRPAGASNRPMKNENILELVRFFQTQDAPLQGSRVDGGSALDIFKAGRRRLLQLAHSKNDRRPKREGAATPTPSGKTDNAYRQLVALQRAGFLPTSSVDRVDRQSLDMARSRSKRDVEAIGQPWLEDGREKKTAESNNNREQASLDLSIGDLPSLVEFSLSFEDLAGPPPYQPTEPSADDQKHETAEMATGPSDSAAVEDRRSSSPESRADEQRRVDSVAQTAHHGAASAPGAAKTAAKLRHDSGCPAEADDGHDAGEKQDAQNQQLRQQTRDQDAQTNRLRLKSTANSSSDPLSARASCTLFPDVLPPRVSSRRSATSSSILASSSAIPSSRQLAHALSIFPSVASASSVKESGAHGNPASDAAVSNDSNISIDSFPLPHGSTFSGNMQSIMSGAPAPVRASSVSRDPFVSSPLRASFHAAIDGAPPPAPTRPLPSLPEPVAAQCAGSEHKSTVSKRRFRPSSTSYPDPSPDQGQFNHDRDGPSAAYSPRHRRVLVPRSPKIARVRSYTAESTSTVGEGDAPSADSKMSSLEHIRRREERVRALRMRDISRIRSHSKTDVRPESEQEKHEEKHYEESPVLGQSAFPNHVRPKPSNDDIVSKRDAVNKEDTSGKEDTPSKSENSLKPDNDRQRLICRSPLPENPHPPPSMPLPADPPVAFVYRPGTQRRTGSTISLALSTSSNGETSVAPGSPHSKHAFHASSVRSSSARSSQRLSQDHIVVDHCRHSRRRSESPSLPSSDDETYGTRVRPGRSREDHSGSQKSKSIPRPQSIVVTDSDSSSYRRKSSSADHGNPPTPKYRASYPPEQSSPRSQYSQRTTNSQESRASQLHSAPQALEARIALLERQNKMLQAALLAALDTGVTFDSDCVRSGLPTPLLSPAGASGTTSSPFMGTGFSPTSGLNGLGLDDVHHSPHHPAPPRMMQKQSPDDRADSWTSSRDRDRRSSFETTASDDGTDSVKELEAMLGGFDLTHPADHSSAAQRAQ
ncbi:conserved hypothetical protein [Paecilomyces variotii No. 5]|uniref:Uncharacterized protein n=1 Tax=Byssochlamys spectabilis (strain No. 5 / NBRC 109023) TaxID=1356009 RepID=V5G0K7_BYSSN|nr:conserved hypothetical protein [Paecilomyces variotii No. 5]